MDNRRFSRDIEMKGTGFDRESGNVIGLVFCGTICLTFKDGFFLFTAREIVQK